MESLKKAILYWEVDTASIMNYKQKILDNLKAKGELPEELCERKAVTMDFSKSPLPTCRPGMATNLLFLLAGFWKVSSCI